MTKIKPFLVDLAQLTAVFGSKDQGLYERLAIKPPEKAHSDEEMLATMASDLGISVDEMRERMGGVKASSGSHDLSPDEVELNASLKEVIDGAVTEPARSPERFTKVLKMLCEDMGAELSSPYIGIPGLYEAAAEALKDAWDLEACFAAGAPYEAPAPGAGHCTPEQAMAAMTAADAADFSACPEPVQEAITATVFWLRGAAFQGRAVILFKS